MMKFGVFIGVHSAMLDDDGGRGHIGLHRPVCYPLQASLEMILV